MLFALAGSTGAVIVAVISAVLAVTLGWIGVVFLRLAPGRLVLTPDGIYHRSLTFEHYVPWFTVYAFSAETGDTPMLAIKANPSDGTRLRRHTGRLGVFEAAFTSFPSSSPAPTGWAETPSTPTGPPTTTSATPNGAPNSRHNRHPPAGKTAMCVSERRTG